MKGITKLLAGAVMAAVCGCQILDKTIFLQDSRLETQRNSGNSARDSVRIPGKQTPAIQTDTEIMCTAVRFPEDFNWRKDSTCGTSDCEILLYRNGEIIRRIKAGKDLDICSDADMHHLVGNDIFTEYSTMTQTIIKMNGDEVVRFEGCELLKGLLFQEGDVFTLSVGRDGNGFSYRRNGNILLQKDYRVYVFGSLEDPSYPETGALYENGNHCPVFCYREMSNRYEYHMVIDGSDSKVDLGEGSKVLDMKVIEDSVRFAEKEAFDVVWDDAYIPFNAPYLVAGCVEGNAAVYDTRRGNLELLCGRDAVVYSDGDISAALYHPAHGKFSVYYTTGECRFYTDPCYFMTRRCGAMVGGAMVVAVNPVDKTKRPYLSVGDEKKELKGLENGYISGFRMTVNQTN